MILASTLPAKEKKPMPSLLPHSAQSPFCLNTRITFAFFHCCLIHLADQQSNIQLLFRRCKAQSTIFVGLVRDISGPATLLSMRRRMAFSTSIKDGGSSSFGMIGIVGRSSRKAGSETWTLVSR